MRHGSTIVFLSMLLFLAIMPVQAAETWQEPVTGMEFVSLSKGCFMMGVPADAFADEKNTYFYTRRIKLEKPQHEVCLDAFWIGRYEVKRSEWHKVMGEEPVSDEADKPVTAISREQASEFASRLTIASGEGSQFRLPTEAEWEYACRAGAPATMSVPYYAHLDDKAWYTSSYGRGDGQRLSVVQRVGLKMPNAFGLHDMLGNAWEWVQDAYLPDAYARHALYNPVVVGPGEKNTIRGGGVRSGRGMVRCETRAWLLRDETQDTVGLRLVRTR